MIEDTELMAVKVDSILSEVWEMTLEALGMEASKKMNAHLESFPSEDIRVKAKIFASGLDNEVEKLKIKIGTKIMETVETILKEELSNPGVPERLQDLMKEAFNKVQ